MPKDIYKKNNLGGTIESNFSLTFETINISHRPAGMLSKYTYGELNPIHKLGAISQANGCGHPNCLLADIFAPVHTTDLEYGLEKRRSGRLFLVKFLKREIQTFLLVRRPDTTWLFYRTHCRAFSVYLFQDEKLQFFL